MIPYDASNFHDTIFAYFMNQQCLVFMNYFCSDFLNTLKYVITLYSTLMFKTYLNIFVQLTNLKKSVLKTPVLYCLQIHFPLPLGYLIYQIAEHYNLVHAKFFFFFISASISPLKSEMIFHHQQQTHWRQIYLYFLQAYCEFYVYFYMATLFQIVNNAS